MRYFSEVRGGRRGKAIGLSLTVLLVVALAGCGGGKAIPPPEMTTYETIAIVPLLTKDPTQGMLISRDLGNQLQIALKRTNEDVQVVFDESAERRPVSDALANLRLKPDEVYQDPSLAGKVAQALKADVILVGRMSEASITTKEDDRPVYDMSNFTGLSKADTRYTIIWQSATSRVWTKLVSAAGEVIWQTGSPPPKDPRHIQVYLRYARAFLSGIPERIAVPEDVIVSHVRDQAWRMLAHELLPVAFPEIAVPVWKEKPTQRLTASGGELRFD
jgi:hypothetical protein